MTDTVTELRLCGQHITSMCDLPYAHQLSDLSNLSVIHFFGNEIRELECLDHLQHLIELNLGSNQIRTLSSAPLLTSLRILDVSCNKITNLSGIENFPNLRSLLIAYNRISSLTPIASLRMLEHLDARNNKLSKLSQLSPLGLLHSLSSVSLVHSSGNPVTDDPGYKTKVLQLCKQLKELDGVSLLKEREDDNLTVLRRALGKVQNENSKLRAKVDQLKDKLSIAHSQAEVQRNSKVEGDLSRILNDNQKLLEELAVEQQGKVDAEAGISLLQQQISEKDIEIEQGKTQIQQLSAENESRIKEQSRILTENERLLQEVSVQSQRVVDAEAASSQLQSHNSEKDAEISTLTIQIQQLSEQLSLEKRRMLILNLLFFYFSRKI
ncbi:hypothetical protein GEMRC1_014041 [Eukaryota sp. GEM-RC1]